MAFTIAYRKICRPDAWWLSHLLLTTYINFSLASKQKSKPTGKAGEGGDIHGELRNRWAIDRGRGRKRLPRSPRFARARSHEVSSVEPRARPPCPPRTPPLHVLVYFEPDRAHRRLLSAIRNGCSVHQV